jgi:hypothetical protein
LDCKPAGAHAPRFIKPIVTPQTLLVVTVSFLRLCKECFGVASLVAIVLASAAVAAGQSSEQDLPTPVRSYEIKGTIPALDMGDPRLTHHFYAFNATHGDLLITVESRNLNGDVDIFTAVNFKPLMKIPMYSQESSSMTTKSVYMRAEDILILRVEARTPNDDNGVYHIRFGGAFAPFNGGIPVAENEETTEAEKSASAPPRRGTRRVSSVGARVEEPPVTMAPESAATSEEKKPEATKSEEPKQPADTGSTGSASPKGRTRAARGPSRTRQTARKPPQAAKAETEKTSDEAPSPKPEVSAETENKANPPPPAPETEKQAAPAATAKQEGTTQPQPGAHLIIVETDGTRIDRPMSTIRRVIIDNGLIVVYLKNGKIERFAMSDVARMTIEP